VGLLLRQDHGRHGGYLQNKITILNTGTVS
jgi:hypothetical protein